jgi:hypothetical protein
VISRAYFVIQEHSSLWALTALRHVFLRRGLILLDGAIMGRVTILRSRIRYMINKRMTLVQVKAARHMMEYDPR